MSRGAQVGAGHKAVRNCCDLTPLCKCNTGNFRIILEQTTVNQRNRIGLAIVNNACRNNNLCSATPIGNNLALRATNQALPIVHNDRTVFIICKYCVGLQVIITAAPKTGNRRSHLNGNGCIICHIGQHTAADFGQLRAGGQVYHFQCTVVHANRIANLKKLFRRNRQIFQRKELAERLIADTGNIIFNNDIFHFVLIFRPRERRQALLIDRLFSVGNGHICKIGHRTLAGDGQDLRFSIVIPERRTIYCHRDIGAPLFNRERVNRTVAQIAIDIVLVRLRDAVAVDLLCDGAVGDFPTVQRVRIGNACHLVCLGIADLDRCKAFRHGDTVNRNSVIRIRVVLPHVHRRFLRGFPILYRPR